MKFIRILAAVLGSLALSFAIFDWHTGHHVKAFWMLGLAIVNTQTLILTKPTSDFR